MMERLLSNRWVWLTIAAVRDVSFDLHRQFQVENSKGWRVGSKSGQNRTSVSL